MSTHPEALPVVVRSAGFEGVGLAIGRALRSQCRGPMLLALLLPLFVAVISAIALLWFFGATLSDWLQSAASSYNVTLGAVDGMLIPIVVGIILLPIAGILGLVAAAIFVMPLVLRHLNERDYPGLQRLGGHVFFPSLWNATWVMLVFAVGWVLSLPLWMVPPLAIVAHVGWWAFAFTKIMRLDALADHATPQERKILQARHNRGFWALGTICALINFLVPPAWFLLPVLSALMFSHFGLEALRRLRSETQP